MSTDETQSVTWREDHHCYLLEVCQENKLLKNSQISERMHFSPLCHLLYKHNWNKEFKIKQRDSFIFV